MYKLIIGMGSCGVSAGARETHERVTRLLSGNCNAELSITGCLGICYREPLLEVRSDEGRFIYGSVNPELAEKIYESHVLQGKPLEEHIALEIRDGNAVKGSELAFIAPQQRIVLRNCGTIDPEKIEE